MKRTDAFAFKVLSKNLEELIDAYGIHSVSLALMTIIDAKAERLAVNWQDASTAKRWAACADAAVALEAKTLEQFGD